MFTMLALAVLPGTLLAQETATITGTVRGQAGAPLTGARVTIPGTPAAALTDAAGIYRLVVPNARGQQVTLRASLIGFSVQEAQVALRTGNIAQNFTLSEQALALDVLVVTGSPAGTATRREVANVVAQVPAAQLVERNPSIQTVTNVLQSRIPGVQVATQSGTEGTAARVRIRGVSSINAGSAPIYVVDGVRMSGGTQAGFNLLGASRSASDAIHPLDIENIEVIKGPAAATLYGADAANGVISITTKRGRPGQQSARVTARTSYGEQEWGGRTFTNSTLCTPARIAGAGSGTLGSFPGCAGAEANTLISADLLREDPKALRTGHTRTYHLSSTGGGERFGYYIGGNYDNNDGVLHNNTFQRISGRSNVSLAPSDKLNADVNLGYYRTNARLPLSDNASSGLTRNANRAIPGRQNAFAVGWLGLSPTEINSFDDQTISDRFIFSSTVRYQPVSWFQNRVSGGFDYGVRKNEQFFRIDETGRAPFGAVAATGSVDQFRPVDRLYTVDYAGTISNSLPRELTSQLSFGSQVIASRSESIVASGSGFASNNVRLIGLASIRDATEGLVEQSTVGFFLEEKIGWRDRLYITAGLRTDDNSAFGREFDFVVYPKLGASYVISEEPFFDRIGSMGVDQLRLRAAWGRAGNAPSPYAAERTFAVVQVVEGDLSTRPSLITSNFGNPQLFAEEGEEYEAGFDASLFNGRIAGDFTYFHKKTKDALIPVPSPPSSGFTSAVLQNVGQISNRGTEMALSVLPIETRNVTWESRVIHATLRNQLDNFGGVRDEPIATGFVLANMGLRITPGAPLPQFFGTVPSRDASGELLRNPNGSLIVDRDTVFFGGSLPTRTLSWDNNLRLFGNLRLGAQLDRQTGHYQINLTRRTRTFDGVTREVILTPTSTAADTLQRQLLVSGAGAQWIEKADFVKLREVSASYSLPTRFTRGFGSDQVVLAISGRNLRTWTDYTGADPEVNATAGDFTLAETNAIPPTRRVTASVTVRF
jgi:TonB-linked SusC/RagA family outer membrane protein